MNRAVVAALAGLFLVNVAHARGGHAIRTVSPCASDYKRLCSKTPVNRAASCLKKHISELSPACRAKYGK